MTIRYIIDDAITTGEFIALLRRSSLSERRPVDDHACMQGMIKNSNLIITARDGDNLVGIARSMTDFHYACYLSDLAVATDYQHSGVGRRLQELTREQLGPRCKLIVIAAPAAQDYYRHIGFTHSPRCWVLEPGQDIR